MAIRTIARRLLPAPLHGSLSRGYQSWRRLYAYPPGADLRRSDYDAYWHEKTRGRLAPLSRWRLRRADVFARVLHPGDTVLDLGTGDGAILQYLIERRGIVGRGLDVSPAAVAMCRRNGLTVDLVDLTRPADALPEGTWQYAILSEILEHLPNPEQVVDALRPRITHALLVSVPNSGFVAHRLRLAFGRFPLQWIVCPGEHLRFWTIADFRWWASQLGFTIAAMHPYEGVRGLRRWWPSLFAAGVVYVLRDSSAAGS